MIIVSGCPRSGTSVTMDILRISLGGENIIGEKLVNEKIPELEQIEGERDAHFVVREYLYSKSKNKHQKTLDKKIQMEDMNPNGFWECEFTVKGINYSYKNRKWLHTLHTKGKNKVCKIVSQGLLQSDPKYIDKMIYLIRHPRNVAKSQERLSRNFDVKFGEDKKNIFDDIVVHTPEMYINVTLLACRWIIENKDIPVLFVEFEKLQKNPEEEIERMAQFVGYGDFDKGKDIVEPKLNRSKQENIENPLWEDAEFIYEKFKKGKFKEIIKAFEDPKRLTNRMKQSWQCTRCNMTVDAKDCTKCINSLIVRENYKKRANILDIDYMNEPCLYECGMNIDVEESEYLTIEESIKYNSWTEDNIEQREMIEFYSNMEGCCGQEDDAIKDGDVVVSLKM